MMELRKAADIRDAVRIAIDDGNWWIVVLPITQDNIPELVELRHYQTSVGRLFFDLALPAYHLRILVCHCSSMSSLELAACIKNTAGLNSPYRDMTEKLEECHITPVHAGREEGSEMARRVIDFLTQEGRDPWKPKHEKGHVTQ